MFLLMAEFCSYFSRLRSQDVTPRDTNNLVKY